MRSKKLANIASSLTCSFHKPKPQILEGETGEGKKEPPSCDRNWAELQRDVLLVIFLKIGMMEVFRAAESVCHSWRKVIKEEPILWRRIHMTEHDYKHLYRDPFSLMHLTRLAIDRSGGQLEEFSVYMVNNCMLQYLCDRTSVLKRLRLLSTNGLSAEVVAETVKRQPLLEEIEIRVSDRSFNEKFIEVVGKECPQLKSFKFDKIWSYHEGNRTEDDEALAISKTMHQLRHLQLIYNRLTNKGLKAILDGCPHLETLDIVDCYNVKMDAEMEARCAKLENKSYPLIPYLPQMLDFSGLIIPSGSSWGQFLGFM
ncbi:RNI-like superfamily protein [Rhynchospora pubera]|uniref:RNI-like superfamily protein n=1 Tax=Rhynchospora pubera TaxID=906938 RepID=A0AAV8FMG7_9POAL|nr:RNI-like superfamily protein [Rhynchospora pubera]